MLTKEKIICHPSSEVWRREIDSSSGSRSSRRPPQPTPRRSHCYVTRRRRTRGLGQLRRLLDGGSAPSRGQGLLQSFIREQTLGEENMATFDTLIDDLASRYGLGVNARSVVKEVLTMITSSPGGLGGFLDRLRSAGLASDVASWLGHSDAPPIAAGEVERALGANALGGIASRLGLTQSAVSTALGYALPKIIGLLTPRGVVPATVPTDVTDLLSQRPAGAAAQPATPRRVDPYATITQNPSGVGRW
ncbi:MAG TPA: YidB family protein, partial [Roseiarcus sp.]